MLVVPQREFQEFIVEGPGISSSKVRRPRHRIKAKVKPQVVLVTLVLTMFLLGLALTTLTAELNAKGLEVYQFQRGIERMESENQRLRLELSRLETPDHIQKVAAEKLGMIFPGSEDIQMVQMDNDSYLGYGLALKENFRETFYEGVDVRMASRSLFRFEGITQALASWIVNPSPGKNK